MTIADPSGDTATAGRDDRVSTLPAAGRISNWMPAAAPAAASPARAQPARPPAPRRARWSHEARDRRVSGAAGAPATRTRAWSSTAGPAPEDTAGASEPRASSAMRASPMSRRRRFGSRSRQRRSRARTRGGTSGGSAAVSIARVSTAASVSDTVSPSNSRRPGEHLVEHDAEGPDVGALVDRLARAPARAPCTPPCPRMMPACVMPASVSVGESQAAASASRSRAPGPWPGRSRAPSPCRRRVTLTLAGFRSRWTMPFSCAASSASAICRAIGSASSGERRRARCARRASSPSTSSITSAGAVPSASSRP